MAETVTIEFIQYIFTGMPEGSMTQVMSQGNRLSQILVKVQCSGNGAGYLGDLEGMG
jgi:hypothetical protein